MSAAANVLITSADCALDDEACCESPIAMRLLKMTRIELAYSLGMKIIIVVESKVRMWNLVAKRAKAMRLITTGEGEVRCKNLQGSVEYITLTHPSGDRSQSREKPSP